jgi:small GTP-binding protein
MDDENLESLKVVLLGNSGVGKTSLVICAMTGEYPAQSDPTVCVNHHRKVVKIGQKEVAIYIWDTAGQEQFQALTPLYCHSASCAIIVAAVDDRDSFKGISGWIELLEKSCDQIPPLILLVNKIDREDAAVVSPEEIEGTYRKTFHAIFFVSAKTGEDVDFAFEEAARVAFRFQSGVGFVSKRRNVSQFPERSGTADCC